MSCAGCEAFSLCPPHVRNANPTRRFRRSILCPSTCLDAIERRWVREHVAVGSRVVDIGCGRSSRMARYPEIAHISGADKDKVAGGQNKDVARFEPWDIENEEPPFEPASFDVVDMNFVLEHLADPEPVLSKALSLLRPGGLLFLVMPNVTPRLARLIRLAERLTPLRALLQPEASKNCELHYPLTVEQMERVLWRLGARRIRLAFVPMLGLAAENSALLGIPLTVWDWLVTRVLPKRLASTILGVYVKGDVPRRG